MLKLLSSARSHLEASVHKECKDRPHEQLLPFSYLVSASHQTFPHSSLSLYSHLTLSVNQDPAKQYSCSPSQTTGLQLALAPP